ncbi:MAG: pyridoxal phosphate-dependent decarboxylase family protein [Acidobacteriota bacterium]
MPKPSQAMTRAVLGDLPEDEFRAALYQAAEWSINYRSRIEERAICSDVKPGDVIASLPKEIPTLPVPMKDIIADFERVILPDLVHWGHPAFLGYFGSTTTSPGIIGEMIAATLNVSAMTWRTSPAATELETLVLQWLRTMLHLPDNYFGVVYDTASVATLHALAAARESLPLNVRALGLCGRTDVPRLRIYTSDQSHSSIVKAAITLGVGEANVKRIPSDSLYQMDVHSLKRAVRDDRSVGYLPLAVVATVGTTSAAAVDPVPQISAFCKEEKIWLHVDAAYGGAMALLPECRHVMDGVADADSVVVNPHKWLFVPLDFSALYITRPGLLRDAFSLVPEYLRGDADEGETNYMDYGIQLGRRFRALKAWMVFCTFGESGLVARIREHIRLAKLFASWLAADPDFELLAPVHMGVVCFRTVCARGNDMESSEAYCNSLNRSVVKAINKTGRAYLTHTVLGKNVAMRIGIGNILTTEQHLAEVFELIKHATRSQRSRLKTFSLKTEQAF